MKAKKNQAEKKRHYFTLRLILCIAVIVDILITIVLANILIHSIDRVFSFSISASPLLWLLLFSLGIGSVLTLATVQLYLKPVTDLSNAMKKVAAGDYSVELSTKCPVGEVRQMQEDFNLMVRELAATEMLKSDFISNVSHEIKTPISAIEGYAMLLQDSAQLPPQQQKYVERILLSTGRLSALVGNILLLSKVENQTIQTNQTRYRLDEQIRQSILLLEPRWMEKNVEFDVEMEEITCTGSEGLLMQVWSNLIGNAIKFNRDGGLVTIRLARQSGCAVFTIEDEGPGIAEDDMRHIYDKFFQSDSSHKQEGNGLGLALARRIVDLCGGDIEAANRREGGCRFTVTLPLRE